jgi:hypothetical protein
MNKKKKVKKTVAKAIKPKAKSQKRDLCERYREEEMCYKCLDLSRSLLLSGDLDEAELAKIRKIMTDIINKRGVLKEDVLLLDRLSDEYLS